MATSHVTAPAAHSAGRFLIVSLDGKAQRPVECYPTAKAALRRAADLQSTVDHYLAQAGAQYDGKPCAGFDREFRECVVTAIHDQAVRETGDTGLHLGSAYAVRELLTLTVTGRPCKKVRTLMRGGKGVFWTKEALARAKITGVLVATGAQRI